MTGRLGEFVEAHGRALVLVVLSFALAGLVFMSRIPITMFPQTDFPRIVVLVDNGNMDHMRRNDLMSNDHCSRHVFRLL